MAFCKEFVKPKAEAGLLRPNFMTPEEQEAGRRQWWEVGVDVDIDNLQTSVRRLKVAVLVLVLGLVYLALVPFLGK